MKQHPLLFGIIFLLLVSRCKDSDIDPSKIIITSPSEIRNSTIALTNVHVIPMTTNILLSEQTVIVEDGLISAVGTTDKVIIPDNAVIIDAKNKGYLIPGLADMHFHRSTFQDLFMFVANGVTVVREMWGSTGMVAVRDSINDNNLDFPQVFVASPGMDGEGGPFLQFTPYVTDVENARELVRQYKQERFDFVKVYNSLEPAVYDAIIDEAKKQDIRVVGHVPFKVEPETAFESGQVTTEHFLGYGYFASSANTINQGSLDQSKLLALAQNSVENDLFHVATIHVGTQSSQDISNIKMSPEYSLISDNLRNSFEDGFTQGSANSEQTEENMKEVLMTLKLVGSQLLLGTDAGFGYMIPGFSIHDELAHYVDAGLSNYEALEAATVNASIFLGMESTIGTIEVGKRADLILLENNPLENISSTRDRAGMILRGNWLSEQFVVSQMNNP